MAQASADFELGVNGNSVAAADPGSATAWDSVTILGASNTLRYDNTHAYGDLAAKIDNATTPASTVAMTWSTAISGPTDHYGRFYLYAGANPAAEFRLIFFNGGSQRLQMMNTGFLRVVDGTGSSTGSTAITLNQFVRIEYHLIHSATVGQWEVRLFNDPDSSTPTGTLSTAANRNTGASLASAAFGASGGGSGGVNWMDNIIAAATDWPGPAPVPPAPSDVPTSPPPLRGGRGSAW
jgi:hypothetical protein